MFSLMMVPNAVFARVLLGQSVIAAVSISAGRWRWPASPCCWCTKRARSPLDGNVPLGVALAIGGILERLHRQCHCRRTKPAQPLPMVSLLAWSMLYGTIVQRRAGAVMTGGPPVFPAGSALLAGHRRFWRSVGSVVTFPLYYGLVRKIGAGRAAYNGMSGDRGRDDDFDLDRRLRLVAAGGIGRGAGADRAWFWRCGRGEPKAR